MSGWTIAAVLGGLLGILIVVLLVVIAKAARRTTENAAMLLEALEDVRRTTLVLSDLEAQSNHTSQVVAEATAALRDQPPPDTEDGHGPAGR